jgi:UDP-2-acetamido-2,6-beta-L-arabino-hexul-4-ose reductase
MSTEKWIRVLVTGAQGFIGKNLVVRLGERANTEVLSFLHGDSKEMLSELVAKSDAIMHLAGANRPVDITDFIRVNADLTRILCENIAATGRHIPLVLASSTQAELENPYGQSKRTAEKLVGAFSEKTGNPVIVYRLQGVFGKWCKPNYNSVVATFCYNIARNIPIKINNPSTNLNLVYVDDVVEHFMRSLDGMDLQSSRAIPPQNNSVKPQSGGLLNELTDLGFAEVTPHYTITLGNLAEQIKAFQNCRSNLMSERVGSGITRALYSTYISYLPKEQFTYDLAQHEDDRGIFVEMLKTPDSGQFSFFTVFPTVTRGSHYHHTKTEKFLVVAGVVRMRFRQVVTGETFEVILSANKLQVVDTIPGWAHDITNIGENKAVIMLWANEVFDRERPDCVSCEV